MRKSYQFAEIKVTLEGDFEYEDSEDYKKFRDLSESLPDFFLRYQKVDNLPVTFGERTAVYKGGGFEIIVADGREYRCFVDKERYWAVVWLEGSQGYFQYVLSEDIEKRLPNTLAVFNHLLFEKMLLQKDAFILHCSFIRYKDRAVLFSAPSGTGKSTQADLWKTYVGTEIINGDRAIVKKADDGWTVYGLPMCGSSKICLNESAPLRAISLISQAPVNKLVPAGASEAVRKIYREITINSWDERYVNRILDMITELCQDAEIYHFECTKDEDAVNLLKYTLDNHQMNTDK